MRCTMAAPCPACKAELEYQAAVDAAERAEFVESWRAGLTTKQDVSKFLPEKYRERYSKEANGQA